MAELSEPLKRRVPRRRESESLPWISYLSDNDVEQMLSELSQLGFMESLDDGIELLDFSLVNWKGLAGYLADRWRDVVNVEKEITALHERIVEVERRVEQAKNTTYPDDHEFLTDSLRAAAGNLGIAPGEMLRISEVWIACTALVDAHNKMEWLVKQREGLTE